MTSSAGRRGRRIVAANRGGGFPPAPSFLGFLFLSLCWLVAGACAPATPAPAPRLEAAPAVREELLDSVERRSFDYFWEVTNPRNGLVPDRAPSPSFSSIAAVGFGLTAYPIGVERGW